MLPDKEDKLDVTVVFWTETPSPSSVSLQGPHQRNLLKTLLKDYNRMERPVANDSHTLTVHFTLSLIQIMDVVGEADHHRRSS